MSVKIVARTKPPPAPRSNAASSSGATQENGSWRGAVAGDEAGVLVRMRAALPTLQREPAQAR
ncbi:MAG: hypothetical protein ACRDIV_27150 [Ktedonobacteraceae bacterium]